MCKTVIKKFEIIWSVLHKFSLIRSGKLYISFLCSIDTKLQVSITSRSWIRLSRKVRAMSPMKLHGLNGCWVSMSFILVVFWKFYGEAYWERCQTFKMELFVKTVNGSKLLTISAKSFILRVSQGFECYVGKNLS